MTPSSAGGGKTGSAALAQLIRDRRKQLGMSRQDLADAAGIPYPTIAQIETGYRGVSPTRLATIARAIGLDPKDMYEVLANDSAPGPAPTARAFPAAADGGVDRAWYANPSFRATQPMPEPDTAAPAAAPPPDVVEQIVSLLLRLPAEERLDALTRVQNRLLTALVEEQVRHANRHKP